MFVHDRMPMPTYDTGGWGYVSLLYVRRDHRGRGLGTQLLSAVERTAVEMGLSKLLLHPADKAVPLYQRSGHRLASTYMVHNLIPSE
jgi:GNAT superfamily N-acetyltransferase